MRWCNTHMRARKQAHAPTAQAMCGCTHSLLAALTQHTPSPPCHEHRMPLTRMQLSATNSNEPCSQKRPHAAHDPCRGCRLGKQQPTATASGWRVAAANTSPAPSVHTCCTTEQAEQPPEALRIAASATAPPKLGQTCSQHSHIRKQPTHMSCQGEWCCSDRAEPRAHRLPL